MMAQTEYSVQQGRIRDLLVKSGPCYRLRHGTYLYPSKGVLAVSNRSKGGQIDRYAAAVGTAIQTIRQEKKVSGADLARNAEISYTTLHHIERGRPADMKTLLAIATALGVTVLDIVSRAEGVPAAQVAQAAPEPDPATLAHAFAGQRASDYQVPDPSPASRLDQAWAPRHSAVTDEQRAWLDRLTWSLLRAADMTNRAATQVMLEELAVSVGLAVDHSTGDDIRRAVNEQRRRRHAGPRQ